MYQCSGQPWRSSTAGASAGPASATWMRIPFASTKRCSMPSTAGMSSAIRGNLFTNGEHRAREGGIGSGNGEGAAEEPAGAPVRRARSSGSRSHGARGLAGAGADRPRAAAGGPRGSSRDAVLPWLPPRAGDRERRVGGHSDWVPVGRGPVRGRSGPGAGETPAAVRGGGAEPGGLGASGGAGGAARRGALLQAREARVLDACDGRPIALGEGVSGSRRSREAHAGGVSAGGAPCRAHAALRSPSFGALSLVFAAFGRRIRPTRRVESDARRRKVMKEMAQEKKANLKAADKAADKEAKAKDAALQAAKTQIERQFGQGSLMRLGDQDAIEIEAISTGALSLDLALGVGGVPRGRVVEIFGPESSGKTTLVYHIIAEAQALGGICAFVDTEHAIDPIYAGRIGVDVDELLVSQPDYGEQALEIVDVLVRSGAVDLVAIDSVAALTPRVELEGQMGEVQVGLQARLMSQALRKLAGNLSRANTVCVFTNQIREKIGVQYGSPETQPGGRALKCFWFELLDIGSIETLKEGTEAVGNRVRVKVVKNKCAAPFRQAEFEIEYGQGISREGELLDFGIEHDIVRKSGAFFSYGETRLGQGRNNAKQYLAENPEIAGEIEAKVRTALVIGIELAPAEAPEQAPPVAEAQAA